MDGLVNERMIGHMSGKSIGFIGAGNMASAMIRGLLAAGLVPPRRIAAVNKTNVRRLADLCSRFGIKKAGDLRELVETSSILVLAAKPSQVPEILEALADMEVTRRLLISVAAGVPLEYMEGVLGSRFALVRSMPNMPAQVGEGVMAASAGQGITDEEKRSADSILASTGSVFWVSEECLDSVTALSGSGPAYFFRLAHDMAAAGASMGLDPALSDRLARQTLAGAGRLLAESPLSLAQLVGQVTSPNGTTAAALSVFDTKRLDLLVEEAMARAAARSREMAQAPSRRVMSKAARIVVKVGSSTVTEPSGNLNGQVLADIVRQTAELLTSGREVILVSSGAVAAGRGRMGVTEEGSVADKQVLSAVGQALLMRTYESLFEKHNITVAQILLTKDDFTSAKRSAICRNTLLQLISRGIVPIINENDAVSFDEIRLGDNDTLSARVAVLVEAGALIILTDTDGLFSTDPRRDPSAKLLRTVEHIDQEVSTMAGSGGTPAGTGGMATKLWAVQMAAQNGIPAVITNGSAANVLVDAASGKEIGTFFAAAGIHADEAPGASTGNPKEEAVPCRM